MVGDLESAVAKDKCHVTQATNRRQMNSGFLDERYFVEIRYTYVFLVSKKHLKPYIR
jgi:hypothetical protein